MTPSRDGIHPGSSPGAARLTTPTIVLYDGHINHNREEHIMPDITLKNGEQFAGVFSGASLESNKMQYVIKLLK